jgi:hypothetical protein
MDALDQLMDKVTTIGYGIPPARTIEYGFVVYISGRWHVGTYVGNASGCNDHIERTLKVDLADPKTRWARGHYDKEKATFVIHPRNDRDAVYTVEQYLTAALLRRR